MKIKILPDGTEEIEGTEEEISAYRAKKEKQGKQTESRATKKRLLVEEIRAAVKEELEKKNFQPIVIGNPVCLRQHFPEIQQVPYVAPYQPVWYGNNTHGQITFNGTSGDNEPKVETCVSVFSSRVDS